MWEAAKAYNSVSYAVRLLPEEVQGNACMHDAGVRAYLAWAMAQTEPHQRIPCRRLRDASTIISRAEGKGGGLCLLFAGNRGRECTCQKDTCDTCGKLMWAPPYCMLWEPGMC